jgi:hypothetical protein
MHNAGDLRGLPSSWRPCGDADHVGDVAGVPGCGRVCGRRGEGLARDPTRSSGPRGWGGSVPTAAPARLISGGRTGRCALAMSESGTVDQLGGTGLGRSTVAETDTARSGGPIRGPLIISRAGERASPPRWISTQQPHRRGQRPHDTVRTWANPLSHRHCVPTTPTPPDRFPGWPPRRTPAVGRQALASVPR